MSHAQKKELPEGLWSKIHIDRGLWDIVALFGVELHGVRVRERDDRILEAMEKEIERLRAGFAGPSAATELFAPARSLYRAIGIDPTRTRPSSEALIRRVLQGKSLYLINSVVDAFNVLSLRFALPVGLYDEDHLQPPIHLRLGEPGEGYVGIRKDFVNLAGRYCLADAAGAFGNPTSDSARTRIRPSTSNVLSVFFAPASLTEQQIIGFLSETYRFVTIYLSPLRCTAFYLCGEESRCVDM